MTPHHIDGACGVVVAVKTDAASQPVRLANMDFGPDRYIRDSAAPALEIVAPDRFQQDARPYVYPNRVAVVHDGKDAFETGTVAPNDDRIRHTNIPPGATFYVVFDLSLLGRRVAALDPLTTDAARISFSQTDRATQPLRRVAWER